MEEEPEDQFEEQPQEVAADDAEDKEDHDEL